MLAHIFFHSPGLELSTQQLISGKLASLGVTLLLALWVVVLAKLLVVVWLYFYNKIL